jgi:hypothetical protein
MRASALDPPTMLRGSWTRAHACNTLRKGDMDVRFKSVRRCEWPGQTRADTAVSIGQRRPSELVRRCTATGVAHGSEGTVASFRMLNSVRISPELPRGQVTTIAPQSASTPRCSTRPDGSLSPRSRSCARPEFLLLPVGRKSAATPPQLWAFAAGSPEGSRQGDGPTMAEVATLTSRGRRS